jgi:hypothetical protein
MASDNRKHSLRGEYAFAAMLLAAGLAIAALSVVQIRAGDPPADPTTTGTRPLDVPPQPARPDADAQKAGAQPALPPAPAEKTAPPIPQR